MSRSHQGGVDRKNLSADRKYLPFTRLHENISVNGLTAGGSRLPLTVRFLLRGVRGTFPVYSTFWPMTTLARQRLSSAAHGTRVRLDD